MSLIDLTEYHLDTNWQTLLKQSMVEPEQLIRFLELPESLIPAAKKAAEQFSLTVTLPYAKRIKKGDLNDPLLKQILPLDLELDKVSGFNTDPLEEHQFNPQPGVVHKYHGRVLLIMTGICAINCRYCFRRHFPYAENHINSKQWQNMLDYIAADDSITEVILSGGDPLSISDARLKKLVQALENIKHIKRLRIHSRLPVVLPQRIGTELCHILENTELNTTLVLHANHAQEINAEVGVALKQLRQAGVTLLNQAVLLKGVNDSVERLKNLSEMLFNYQVLPYYLFTLDPVAGAAHFNVKDEQAQHLVSQLQGVLPGYLVPKLAREIPDKAAKTLLPIHPIAPYLKV